MDPPDRQHGFVSAYGSVSPAVPRRGARGGSATKGKFFALLASATALAAVWHVSNSGQTHSQGQDADDVWFFGTTPASNSLSAKLLDERPRAVSRAVDSAHPAVKFDQMGLVAPKWFMKFSGDPRKFADHDEPSELAAGNYTHRGPLKAEPPVYFQIQASKNKRAADSSKKKKTDSKQDGDKEDKKEAKEEADQTTPAEQKTEAEKAPEKVASKPEPDIPVPVLDNTACYQILCEQDPPISDNGAAWRAFEMKNDEKPDQDVIQCLKQVAKSIVDKKKKDGEDSGERVSWINEQACQYGLQMKQKQGAADEATAAADEESRAAQAEKRNAIKNEVQPSREPKDLPTVQKAEDPNETPFEPAEIKDPDCDNLHVLPGVEFLSSGYDPSVRFPCGFDDCRTRRIHKFTYADGCRTVITPGGTFKIPDQISVLNKYETTASTHVYQDQAAEDLAVAAHANMAYNAFSAAVNVNVNNKQSKEQHKAERKIDVKLYTLYVETLNSQSAQGLEPDFITEASELPTRFGDDPNAFLEFLRKWGRYSPVSASFGGTVLIEMTYTTSADQQDIGVGVEAAYDGITGSFGGGVNVDSSAAKLMADSQIDLSANGGDPQIASAISDFSPQTDKTITFRGDLQAWLKSVPQFPRLVERVPQLQLITACLPTGSPSLPTSPPSLSTGASEAINNQTNETIQPDNDEQIYNDQIYEQDRLEWKMRRLALEEAIEVMSISKGSLHASRQQCDTEFGFKDYNRFNPNECLSFSVHAPGDFAVSIAELPTRNEASIRLRIGVHETCLEMWDPESSQWTKQWTSTSAAGAAMGSESLMGSYWMCMQGTSATEATNATTTFYFGSRADLVLKQDIVLKSQNEPFRPRYFALSCKTFEGYFSNIKVHPFEKYAKYLRAEVRSSDAVGQKTGRMCSIPNCEEVSDETGATAAECRCKICDSHFLLVKGNEAKSEYDYCAKRGWKIETTANPARYLARTNWNKNKKVDYIGCYQLDDAELPGQSKLESPNADVLFSHCLDTLLDTKGGFCMDDQKCYYPGGAGAYPGVQASSFFSARQFQVLATAKGRGKCDQFFTPMYGAPNAHAVGCFTHQNPMQAYYTGPDQSLCFGANGVALPNVAGCFDLSTLFPLEIAAGFAWKVTGRYRFNDDLKGIKYKWCMEAVNEGSLAVGATSQTLKTLFTPLQNEGMKCSSEQGPAKSEEEVSIQVTGLYTVKGGKLWNNLWIRMENGTDYENRALTGFQPEA